MTTLIIQEHNERTGYVTEMLKQAAAVPQIKEVIICTSADITTFDKPEYHTFSLPVRIIGNIHSCGRARDVGARLAIHQFLLFTDCHVCFKPEDVKTLMKTFEQFPSVGIIAPCIHPIKDFPSCEPEGGSAGGVAFFFDKTPFEWRWLPSEDTNPHKVPFCCGCAFMMKKDTYTKLTPYGGFLGSHTGLGIEEEVAMRLWRIGCPTIIQPKVAFGHIFKGYANKPEWDEHSTRGYYQGRAAAIYVNTFNQEVWDYIEECCIKYWGNEIWADNIQKAKSYNWLRRKLEKHKDHIDEKWFFRKG